MNAASEMWFSSNVLIFTILIGARHVFFKKVQQARNARDQRLTRVVNEER